MSKKVSFFIIPGLRRSEDFVASSLEYEFIHVHSTYDPNTNTGTFPHVVVTNLATQTSESHPFVCPLKYEPMTHTLDALPHRAAFAREDV